MGKKVSAQATKSAAKAAKKAERKEKKKVSKSKTEDARDDLEAVLEQVCHSDVAGRVLAYLNGGLFSGIRCEWSGKQRTPSLRSWLKVLPLDAQVPR
jgi:hypothetical protein